MSKFFKALEQAERERALQEEALRAGLMRAERPPGAPDTPDRATRVPVGSELGAHRAESFDGVEEHLVSLLHPTGFEAESYRALRQIVEGLNKNAGLSMIAISSPGVGEGKTITAINLAGALAQAPQARILLVDADLRQPSMADKLRLDDAGRRGLVDAILNPGLALEAVVQSRPPFNLAVLPAGNPPAAPYEVLKAPRLGELL